MLRGDPQKIIGAMLGDDGVKLAGHGASPCLHGCAVD